MSRWSILLAGGEGQRLRRLTDTLNADRRPKQFCILLGDECRTMLDLTIERARLFSPAKRTVVSACRPFRRWIDEAVDSRFLRSVEPWSAGTGVAALLAALQIEKRDPSATIAIFPCDHYVSDDLRFVSFVREAAVWVEREPDDIVLIGVEPDRPETAYGWLLPKHALGHPSGLSEAQLIEKPSRREATYLIQRGACWNTSVVVFRVKAFLRLCEILVPGHWRELEGALDGGLAALEEAYERSGVLDLSRDILSRAPRHLRTLVVNGVEWADVGSEERLFATPVFRRAERRRSTFRHGPLLAPNRAAKADFQESY